MMVMPLTTMPRLSATAIAAAVALGHLAEHGGSLTGPERLHQPLSCLQTHTLAQLLLSHTDRFGAATAQMKISVHPGAS